MVPDAGGPAAPVISLDGPGGSGKSTLAKRLADTLGWKYLNSGAIYRMIAAGALASGLDLNDEQALVKLAAQLKSDRRSGGGSSAGAEDLQSERVAAAASTIAAYANVRAAVLAVQRATRGPPGLVADGRDMGTVVFPDAELKMFLDASAQVRAERRRKQLKNKGLNVSFRALLAGIRERDARDRERAAAPLKPAADAIVIDSTAMSLDEVHERALALARERGLSP